jgi:hypothetical protein
LLRFETSGPEFFGTTAYPCGIPGISRNMELLVILLLIIGVAVVIFNRRVRGKREP